MSNLNRLKREITITSGLCGFFGCFGFKAFVSHNPDDLFMFSFFAFFFFFKDLYPRLMYFGILEIVGFFTAILGVFGIIVV